METKRIRSSTYMGWERITDNLHRARVGRTAREKTHSSNIVDQHRTHCSYFSGSFDFGGVHRSQRTQLSLIIISYFLIHV